MSCVLTSRSRLLPLALIAGLAGATLSCSTPKSVQAQQGKGREVLDLGKVTRKRQIAPICSDAEWLTRP